MRERFIYTGTIVVACDVTSGCANGVLDLIYRVRGASRHRRERAVQHRDIVVMIARGENVFARNADQARQLSQGCALVIISVTKPQLYRVALVMEFRLFVRGLAR